MLYGTPAALRMALGQCLLNESQPSASALIGFADE